MSLQKIFFKTFKNIHVATAMTTVLLLNACATVTPSNPSATNTAAPAIQPTSGTSVVRLAYFPNFTHATGLVAVANGTVQKAIGSNTKLDVKSFNAGPALIEALLAGEIDIGYVGPSPAINGYVKSKGSALRIIAGASSGGALFVVKPSANIKSAKDLAGKKIATPQKGGTQDIALRKYVSQNGLKTADEGGTVTVLPTANPDILTLFKQNQLDGAWVPEPWATRLLQEAGGEVFIDERAIWPDGKFSTTLIVVSTKFLKQSPDLVKAVVKAHVQTDKFVRENAAEAKSIANKEIERITSAALPNVVLDAAFRNVDFSYDPYASTVLVGADDAFKLGFLGDTQPNLDNLFDFSVLNEVLKEQGLPLVKAVVSK
ncbi:MAG: ABC transporter substrate-binding protein [Chloroflexi bacterium]|nr:ABC transporter substrate-binding protein [Chloroflexota bacterium]